MKYYADHSYGLYIPYQCIEDYCKSLPEKEAGIDAYPGEFEGEFGESIGLTFHQDDDKSNTFFSIMLNDGCCGEVTKEDTFFFLQLKRYPSLIEAPYNSLEQALEELKDSISEYLPADFDYSANFVEFYGVSFG